MLIRMDGHTLPTTTGQVRVGVQRGKVVEQLFGTDARDVSWHLDVTLHRTPEDSIDLRGPYVHGLRGNRFLYLSWGTMECGAFVMFRRIKLMLAVLDDVTLRRADAEGHLLVGTLGLTGKDGTPRCGAVRPPDISWAVATSSLRPQG